MSADIRPWYRRPWRITGLIVGVVILGVVVAFGLNVARYMSLIKSGQFNPETDLREARLQSSVSTRFANANATAADIARIVPTSAVPTLGSPTATVTIVEFLDYQCPYCRKAAPLIRAFMAKHASDVRLIVRDFPITEIHADAENASIAANCVFRISPSRYWDYHDRLFSSQSALSPEDLRLYAGQMRVDMTKYDTCVNSKLPLASIQQSLDDGIVAGVQGTPTFFFNGVKIQGVLDEQALEIIVKEARAIRQQK